MFEAGQYAAKLFQLAGAILGMLGASWMANQYTKNVRSTVDLAGVLLSSLFGGKSADGLVSVSEISPDERKVTFKGLGLVFLGFLLQSLGMLIDLVLYWIGGGTR